MNGTPMKVILVEDSPRVRQSIKHMLSEIAGVVVSGEFSAAGEAIRGIDVLRPHLVILDIGLHNSNGLDVLSHVQAVHPGIRTIVFSDRTSDEYQTRISQLGATHFFNKTGETESLFNAVVAMSVQSAQAAGN